MIDLLKKAMFAGIGLALKTKEEVEEFASDLVQRAELSENEGKKFVNDFMKRYDESKEKLEEKVERTVRDLLAKANFVTREEMTEVKDEIQHMRKTLSIEDSSAADDDR